MQSAVLLPIGIWLLGTWAQHRMRVNEREHTWAAFARLHNGRFEAARAGASATIELEARGAAVHIELENSRGQAVRSHEPAPPMRSAKGDVQHHAGVCVLVGRQEARQTGPHARRPRVRRALRGRRKLGARPACRAREAAAGAHGDPPAPSDRELGRPLRDGRGAAVDGRPDRARGAGRCRPRDRLVRPSRSSRRSPRCPARAGSHPRDHGLQEAPLDSRSNATGSSCSWRCASRSAASARSCLSPRASRCPRSPSRSATRAFRRARRPPVCSLRPRDLLGLAGARLTASGNAARVRFGPGGAPSASSIEAAAVLLTRLARRPLVAVPLTPAWLITHRATRRTVSSTRAAPVSTRSVENARRRCVWKARTRSESVVLCIASSTLGGTERTT
jgi:hypothetical protein